MSKSAGASGTGANLATRNGAGLTETEQVDQELLSFMEEHGKEGKELVKSDDITIPRIAIIQAMSPQVRERKAGPGDLFNIITGANYGTEMQYIPLFFFTSRIFWESRDPGAKILCQARDGENGTTYGNCGSCAHKDFTTNSENGQSEQPRCTAFKNILAIPYHESIPIHDQTPVAISAKRTGLKEMSSFITNAVTMRLGGKEVPLYMQIWTLKTQEETNEKGTYSVPKFSSAGLIKDVPTLKYLQGVYLSMKSSQDRFNIVQENGEVEGAMDAEFKAAAETDRY